MMQISKHCLLPWLVFSRTDSKYLEQSDHPRHHSHRCLIPVPETSTSKEIQELPPQDKGWQAWKVLFAATLQISFVSGKKHVSKSLDVGLIAV